MQTAAWRLVVASAVGTSHITTCSPCQDSADFATLEIAGSETLLIALSDGAGSAKHSDIASRIAVRRLVQLATDFLEDGGSVEALERGHVLTWVSDILVMLHRISTEAEHSIRDYACTLLAALVSENCCAFIQIGDGAIVVSENEEDGWNWVFWPQHGEFANTTNFLISPDALDVLEFESSPRRIEEIALFSDGLENLLLQNSEKAAHAPFFNTVFPPVRAATPGFSHELSQALHNYLVSPVICDRTDDDKSLMLASRRASPQP